MQIKHTFLFTLLLGLAWSGYVFAHEFGPDTGYNGVLGPSINCTSGCHNSFPVNSGNGDVSLTGQPASWVPGQTYPLTVTVQPATQPASVVYGFQLSAVIDGTNPPQQAGTLAKVNNAVQVICGPPSGNVWIPGIACSVPGAIQFAEHTIANSTRTFTVNWTAPSSPAGTVRFNLAGNAANGDFTNLGDHIYTKVYSVSAGAAPPPSHAFTMVDRGGVSIITDGSGAQTAGYSRIVPDSGKTTPTGVAIFGFHNASNILASETGVPATPLISAGRIYAEVAGALNTGVAIANRNDSAATISFSFTDATGVAAGSGGITIQPNQQIAQFLNQSPFNVYPGATFQGTFSFTSTAPVGVIALRGLTNERGDFLMSTLPVIDPTAAPGTGTVVVPHFADGGGWITQIFLVNPTDNALTGNVQFTDPNGAATRVTIAGVTSNSFRYSVPGRSSQKLATAGAGSVTASGSVRVVPDGGGTVPVALVVFSYRPAGVTVTEAGVPVTSGNAFRLYVEAAGTTGQSGNIQTGIAVANTSSSSAAVTFDITDLNGGSVGISPFTLTLPPSGQAAKFLGEIFPGLQPPFKGVVRITTPGSLISVVGLRARYNERQPTDFLITTTPPSNEAGAASSAELVFPHLVNGGGYTTQFILFSGTAGQSSSGNLRFLKQDGTAFNLNVN
jgi:hypothetical protein